jgi:predicted O-methyltransferase YrrM
MSAYRLDFIVRPIRAVRAEDAIMSVRSTLKSATPQFVINARRRWLAWRQRRRDIASVPRESRALYLASIKSHRVELPPRVEGIRERVINAARHIHGDDWNHYSDALRPEIVEGFLRTIDAAAHPVRYLEIGSNRGLSMAVVSLILQDTGRLVSATSIDPYFASGYDEGLSGPYLHLNHVQIDKRVRDLALDLYVDLGIAVELIEMTSRDGLRHLIASDRTFDLIYIDGSHEALNPAADFGLSLACLASEGMIILDDHQWPDVAPIKTLCDLHCDPVWITWKTAAYRLRGQSGSEVS